MTMLRVVHVALLAALAALLVLFRQRVLEVPPGFFALGASLLLLLYVIDCVASFRARQFAPFVLLLGAILIFAGGLANWLYSLQGYVILSEIEAIPLGATAHLVAFDGGPLSDVDDMSAFLLLLQLALIPSP